MIPLLRLPRLHDEPWRDGAACAGHPLPWLWDAVRYEGEPRKDRELRHATAKTICRTSCPVRDECLAAVDPRVDEGIRGGRLLADKFAVKRSAA